MSESLILQKARHVLAQAEGLVGYLEKNGLTQPDYDNVTSDPYPTTGEFNTIRTNLVQAAQDVTLLANGPMDWLRTFFCHHHDLGAWQTALRFGYFSLVPLDGSASVKEMAAKAGMDEDRLGRVMKLLASQRCFREVEEDVYAHTALSALVAKDKNIEAAIAFQADEMFEAASLTATSIQKAPYESTQENSAFNLKFGTSPYQWYAANPERGARFAAAMAVNNDNEELRTRFPWGDLGKCTIVDVGGGSGHISIFLANQFPDLEFIVQDVNQIMLTQGPKRTNYPAVEGRVSFMHHDFFSPQPVRAANLSSSLLFFIRQGIHNYNDERSVEIFKNLVPGMQEGEEVRLLINDMVLPEMNELPKVEEHHLRQLDIAMLNGYAAKQRTLAQFETLLKRADERFEIVIVHGKGVMGLIEVQFNTGN